MSNGLTETKDFQIIGKLIEKNDVVQRGTFSSREFVLEKENAFNGKTFYNYIKFQCVQDRTNIVDNVEVGDQIHVSFNIKGNKWVKEGKTLYFTNLDAWRVQKVAGDEAPANQEFLEPLTPMNAPDEDDLPF